MKFLFQIGFFVSCLTCCISHLHGKEVTHKRYVCPVPSPWGGDRKCARKKEPCYSSYFSTDSCRERLACRFTSRLVGPIWDDGVSGICTRKPKNLSLCKDTCSTSPSKTKCYLHSMIDVDSYGVTIPSSDRFYTTCGCYGKCFRTIVRMVAKSMSVKSDVSVRQISTVSASPSHSASPSPSASFSLFRTCSC